MRLVVKLVGTLVLAAITALCGFGFLASFEPPGFLFYRWLYGVVSVACILAIVAVWLEKSSRR